MSPRLSRRVLLLILCLFATIGAVAVFRLLNASSISQISRRDAGILESEEIDPEIPSFRDVPFLDEPTERLDLVDLGLWNTVKCWPSVGGIIVNPRVSSAELDYLKLSRFAPSPRSENTTEEDDFCRQLRKTSGKWWVSWYDFTDTMDTTVKRPISAKERESLLLAWPKKGGVWVRNSASWGGLGARPGSWRLTNAYTMEERCKAMEMSGDAFYENPDDCELVKPLLDGFGEHEREPESNYYFDYPRDHYHRL